MVCFCSAAVVGTSVCVLSFHASSVPFGPRRQRAQSRVCQSLEDAPSLPVMPLVTPVQISLGLSMNVGFSFCRNHSFQPWAHLVHEFRWL